RGTPDRREDLREYATPGVGVRAYARVPGNGGLRAVGPAIGQCTRNRMAHQRSLRCPGQDHTPVVGDRGRTSAADHVLRAAHIDRAGAVCNGLVATREEPRRGGGSGPFARHVLEAAGSDPPAGRPAGQPSLRPVVAWAAASAALALLTVLTL